MDSYWTVTPEWKGETVFIIGGGTSVCRQNVSRLEGRKVIAVNSSYEVAPFAQFLFFGDNRWWEEHRQRPALVAFKGRLVTVSGAATGDRLLKLKRVRPDKGPGLSTKPDTLSSQKTSLQGAMNLAFLLGASRMVLLGADMRRADDGRSHHHSPHKWRNKPGNGTWDIQLQDLALIVEPLRKHGVEVFNTSPISRLPFWPKAPLESFVET